MFGAVFVVTAVLGVWIWMKMVKVKKVLLEEQAQRRQAKLEEEMRAADKEAEQRRFETSEPQAAPWGMPSQQMSMPRVPPGEYVVRQSWGLPEPSPGRAF